MTIACLLLAAGQSKRFGAGDKIAAPLNDTPLGLHAARTLRALPLASHFVVTNRSDLDWSGWTIVRNGRPDTGIGHSIALGTTAARAAGATAILLALGDMPFVPASHFERLLAHYRGPDSLAASSDGQHPMPPALFGARWFDALEALCGDRGARGLLDQAALVETLPDHLADVDSADDLQALQRRFLP